MNPATIALHHGGTIAIPFECVAECRDAHPASDAVMAWADSLSWDAVTPEAIREELRREGGWDDEELADDSANRERLVWVLARELADEYFHRGVKP